MTKLVAVLLVEERYTSYDDYDDVIKSITEWSEVTDEEYNKLARWCKNHTGYAVVERIDLKPTGLAEIFKKIEQEEQVIKEKALKAKAAAEKKAKTLKAAQEAKEKKLLEQLQAKYGELK